MMASAPIFLMKADMTATTIIRKASCRLLECISGKYFLIVISTMPERATAELTISALPTMMTISSEKPEKAFSKGTTPTATATSNALQATTS